VRIFCVGPSLGEGNWLTEKPLPGKAPSRENRRNRVASGCVRPLVSYASPEPPIWFRVLHPQHSTLDLLRSQSCPQVVRLQRCDLCAYDSAPVVRRLGFSEGGDQTRLVCPASLAIPFSCPRLIASLNPFGRSQMGNILRSVG